MIYYHHELFVKYNSHPTPKLVHNPNLALITLLVYDSIQGQSVERLLVILLNVVAVVVSSTREPYQEELYQPSQTKVILLLQRWVYLTLILLLV